MGPVRAEGTHREGRFRSLLTFQHMEALHKHLGTGLATIAKHVS